MRMGPLGNVFALSSRVGVREPEVDALKYSCILDLFTNLRKLGVGSCSLRWIGDANQVGRHDAELHLVGVEVQR